MASEKAIKTLNFTLVLRVNNDNFRNFHFEKIEFKNLT